MLYSQANENGFSNKFISKLTYEYENSNKISTIVSKAKSTIEFCSIGYIAFFVWIRHAPKKYNIILIAKSPTKLEYLVHRNIGPIDKYDKSGIYTIYFNVNSSFKTYKYVDMTTRNLFLL